MSTQCRFCGAAVRPNTMFCPSCGQLVVAATPPAEASALPPPFRTTGGGPRATPRTAEPAAPAAPIAPVPLPESASAASARTVAPPAPVPPAALVLRLPGGVEHAIDRELVLGRNPAGRSPRPDGVPVEVPDPTRSVSRTHLVVRPGAPGEALAEDLGSGNGTLLERMGARRPLRPHEAVAVRAGDRLVLGDVVIDVGTAR